MKASEKAKTVMTFDKTDSQALKGVAILFMLFHHCYYSVDRFERYDVDFLPLSMEQAMDLAMFFKICVALFVFISSYGITISFQRNGDSPAAMRKNISGRYITMMTGYWFVFLLSCIAFAFLDPMHFVTYYTRDNPASTVVNVIFDALGISFLCDTPTLNPTWWYISFAIVLIAVIPLFIRLYKRYGAIPALIVAFFLRYAFVRHNFEITRYLMIMVLGIICADRNYLGRARQTRWVKFAPVDYILKTVVLTAILHLMFFARVQERVSPNNTEIRDGIIPLFVVFYCYMVIFPIKPVKKILEFLGKHSMNIFLTHTFLRVNFLSGFIYSFKNAYLIVAVLLATSLALALAIYGLEKLVRLDRLIAWLKKKAFAGIDAMYAKEQPEPAPAAAPAGANVPAVPDEAPEREEAPPATSGPENAAPSAAEE